MAASELLVTNGATPTTPAAGKTKIFVDSSKRLSTVNDAGTVTTLAVGVNAVSQATPANPTGTTNTSGLMMGLAGSITPALTGRVLVILSGNISNSTAAAGDGGKVRLRYGTGSAPANAGALTGTVIGNQVSMLLERATASDPFPFSIQAVVTGLLVGTTYWLDVDLAAITGGTAILTNLSLTAVEI